jgi:hypothetical protein
MRSRSSIVSARMTVSRSSAFCSTVAFGSSTRRASSRTASVGTRMPAGIIGRSYVRTPGQWKGLRGERRRRVSAGLVYGVSVPSPPGDAIGLPARPYLQSS